VFIQTFATGARVIVGADDILANHRADHIACSASELARIRHCDGNHSGHCSGYAWIPEVLKEKLIDAVRRDLVDDRPK